MLVGQLMSAEVITLNPDVAVRAALEILHKHELLGAPVVDEGGKLLGVFDQAHVLKCLMNEICFEQKVKRVMAKSFFALPETMRVEGLQQEKQIYMHMTMPVVDDENKVIGVVYQADLLMYLSEHSLFLAEELKAVLNSLYNGVIATNADGAVTLFNRAAEAMTGIQADTVLGRYIEDIVPTTGLRRVMETRVSEQNQPQMLGKANILTNRSPIMKGNRSIGAVAVFQELTEVQQMAEELESVKKLQSTLESAMESSFEGIVVVDKEARITMINRAYSDFLGCDGPEGLIGQHVTQVIPNTRLHYVAKTGAGESGAIQRMGDHNVVVQRIPIMKDGEVVGAVGKVLFKDVKDMKNLYSRLNRLQSEVEYYREESRKVQGCFYTIEHIIGTSEKMRVLKSIAGKVAKSNSTALIFGESGTGKELLAHALHNASLRAEGPFIKLNCAAVPENLLESELFGYEEGAFTGARKGGKPGRFELANGGTLFLDEIGDMPLIMQAKLLRVLQEREFERVGGTKSFRTDVRIIAATNRDLEAMVGKGEFRQDLYYRLNVIFLNIPPLRERREDIPLLCDVLLKKIENQMPHRVGSVTQEVMDLFFRYPWTGNVRELENVLERAVNWSAEDGDITAEHLPPQFRNLGWGCTAVQDGDECPNELSSVKHHAEREAILQALQQCGGNKSRAAKFLGINRSGLYQKLSRYNID